jgi:putative transposase
MKNHVHFIAKPAFEDSLAKTFSVTHMRYAHYLNSKRKQNGHLWQGRFYSCALGSEHIYRAVRYVERNPVRAGIVKYPWDFKWSSASAHLGKSYNVIKLADIRSYVIVESWKQYLMEEEVNEELEDIRKMTRQGK